MTRAKRNFRWLYLLALFQLVAGPLALLTVLTFCQVTVREVPSQGLIKAISAAWQSAEVQSVVHAACDLQADDGKSSVPAKKTKVDTKKIFGIAWQPTGLFFPPVSVLLPSQWSQSWSPAWPQAPPGHPPRAV